MKTHFTPLEYDGGIQNWSFDQDEQGLIYVANNFGLLQFDGIRWENYPFPYSTKLRAVKVHNGRIYVGGQGQIGFFMKDSLEFHFVSLLERLPENEREISETWKIISHEDKLYFNTYERLLVLDGDLFSSIDLPGRIIRFHQLFEQVLVQIENKGIYELKHDSLIFLEGSNRIDQEIIGSYSNEKKRFLISSSGVVFDIAEEFRQIETAIQGNIINTTLTLNNGNLAIGTQNNGLIILNMELMVVKHLTHDAGLTNRTVNAIYEDQFQNLWVGLHSGIDYLEFGSPISFVNEESGLEGSGYVAVGHSNQYYLGTNNGLYKLNDNQNGYELIKGSEGQVYNVSKLEDDLILCHHKGGFQIKGGDLIQINDVGTWKLAKSPNAGVAIGGDYSGFSIYEKKNGVWKKAQRIDSVNESSRVFEFDENNMLWMTHGYKGAYKIELSKDLKNTLSVQQLGFNEGMPSDQLISVYPIENHLIFTGEVGVYDFIEKNNRFQINDFLNDNIGNKHVSKLFYTPKGDIYYIEDRKIGWLQKDSFGSYLNETSVFERINKYLTDDLENINYIDSRNVLFGAKEGFIHFDPESKFEILEDFSAIIKRITVNKNDTSYTYFSEFLDSEFAYNDGLVFEFSSPYFDGFKDITFSYRISEDEKWSDWSSATTKEYSRLSPGDFKFQLKAKNIYGNESKIATYAFTINSPWYSAPVSIAGYLFLGFILLTLAPFLQRKKYKRETFEIVKDSQKALESKDKVIDEITEKSNKELTTLRNEKLRTEIEHKNGQLSSVTTHLLQKNQLLKDLLKNIESATSKNEKSEFKRVIKSIQRNLNDDSSWDQFAQHFGQVHGDFLNKLSENVAKLTPQETKLAAYLRMNMTSKEIAHLMNISVRGVELARYRLRKKLQLDRDQNLTEYLLQY